MSESYQELRALPDSELIAAHDREALHTVVGTAYYLDELRGREQLSVTKSIRTFTIIVTMATILNLLLEVYRPLRA